jgi:energy-coupling factor transport system permease protein
LGDLILHPDRTFSFFSKYMGNSALFMNMTLRLFPTIFKSLNNIIEVEKLRGNRIFDKSIKRSIRNQTSIINILFMTCLEDAADMAESMHSRGYGIGKRNVYFHESLSKYDMFFYGVFVLMCMVFGTLQYYGLNTLAVYPVFENPFRGITTLGITLSLLFYMPVIINWGWKKWL